MNEKLGEKMSNKKKPEKKVVNRMLMECEGESRSANEEHTVGGLNNE